MYKETISLRTINRNPFLSAYDNFDYRLDEHRFFHISDGKNQHLTVNIDDLLELIKGVASGRKTEDVY